MGQRRWRNAVVSVGGAALSSDGQIMDPAPADDAPMWPQPETSTVNYGQVRYNGDTVFAVTENGLTVWNTQTGHGALINTSGVQQF